MPGSEVPEAARPSWPAASAAPPLFCQLPLLVGIGGCSLALPVPYLHVCPRRCCRAGRRRASVRGAARSPHACVNERFSLPFLSCASLRRSAAEIAQLLRCAALHHAAAVPARRLLRSTGRRPLAVSCSLRPTQTDRQTDRWRGGRSPQVPQRLSLRPVPLSCACEGCMTPVAALSLWRHPTARSALRPAVAATRFVTVRLERAAGSDWCPAG